MADLMTAPKRTNATPYTREELKELAMKIARSGMTPAGFAKEHGIPPFRCQRAWNAFEGLIVKTRRKMNRKPTRPLTPEQRKELKEIAGRIGRTGMSRRAFAKAYGVSRDRCNRAAKEFPKLAKVN